MLTLLFKKAALSQHCGQIFKRIEYANGFKEPKGCFKKIFSMVEYFFGSLHVSSWLFTRVGNKEEGRKLKMKVLAMNVRLNFLTRDAICYTLEKGEKIRTHFLSSSSLKIGLQNCLLCQQNWGYGGSLINHVIRLIDAVSSPLKANIELSF